MSRRLNLVLFGKGGIDKSNLTTTLKELSGMRNITEQQWVGFPKRENLEIQLERLIKAIYGEREIESREEQSLDVAKEKVSKIRTPEI